ncbi:hypothetical protein, partial [Sphingomonas sp. 1F27F7B]|jgi:hypothetical protein
VGVGAGVGVGVGVGAEFGVPTETHAGVVDPTVYCTLFPLASKHIAVCVLLFGPPLILDFTSLPRTS